MGLDNREKGKYITIYDGKFTVRVPEGTAGATVRVNKQGKTVHEKYYDSFTGKLVGIKTADSPYGLQWMFDFQDGGEVYHLQLSYSNSFATNILKMLPNIDLQKEMKVQPAVKEVEGKKKSSLFISQGGVTIKHAYTMANPNGLPPMEEITLRGVKSWDDTKRLEFLHAMVIKDIVPKLPKPTVASSDSKPTGLEVGGEALAGTEDDFEAVVNEFNGTPANTEDEPF